jgi:hypothetical protein
LDSLTGNAASAFRMYTARCGFIAILEKKMNFLHYSSLLALPLLALAGSPAFADMYRCKGTTGQVAYQDTPCLVGAETVIGPRSPTPESTDAAIARLSKGIDDELARRGRNANAYSEKMRPQREAYAKAHEKEDSENLAKFYQTQEQRKVTLRSCLRREKDADCAALTYGTLLVGMHRSDVDDVLGDPRTQKIGGSELLYYVAPIFEGRSWRSGRLQIHFGVPSNIPDGARGRTNRVTEVNVY